MMGINNKHLLILFLSVIIVMMLSASVVDARKRSARSNLSNLFTKECTPETCQGPVQVYFEYQNCTGEKYYQHLEFAVVANGSCQAHGEHSHKVTIHSDSLEDIYFDGPTESTCQDGPGMYIESDVVFFGVCFVLSSVKRADGPPGSMYLPNVNATFQAPQEHVQGTAQSAELTYTECSPGNCTNDGTLTFIYDYYNLNNNNEANQCTTENRYMSSAYHGFTPNVCYNGPMDLGYTMYVCPTPNSYTQLFFGGMAARNSPGLTPRNPIVIFMKKLPPPFIALSLSPLLPFHQLLKS